MERHFITTEDLSPRNAFVLAMETFLESMFIKWTELKQTESYFGIKRAENLPDNLISVYCGVCLDVRESCVRFLMW